MQRPPVLSTYFSYVRYNILSQKSVAVIFAQYLSREIFPFSFREYLSYQEVEVDPDRVSAKQKAVLLHHLANYLSLGGFPETLGASEWVHREILQSYIQIVIYRDIVERHKISSITVLERWIAHCLKNPASPLSINKVYRHFKSLGLHVSKNSLYEWLEYIEDSYALFSVGCFDLSERKSSLKPKKVYPVDPGLITAFAIHLETIRAACLETAVFCALRRKTDRISYYSTKQGLEVDFVHQTLEGAISLYQVSLTIQDNETRTRELRALSQAMRELNLQEAHIITLEEEETITTSEGTVHVIPAWKFLLS